MVAPKLTPSDVDDLVQLYETGQSIKALAQRYSVDRGTVTKRLRERGITIRPISEAQRLVFASWTPERRRAMAAYAFEAKRGKPNSWERLCDAAVTREQRATASRPNERRLAEWLAERGVTTIPQRAIGPYNCDLAADSVAIEVFGGNWHATGHHALQFPERARYILDQGWCLVIVWDQTRDPLSVDAADYVVAFHQQVSRDPSMIGEYRVIRGCGEELSRGRDQLDDRALIPSQRRTPRRRA